MITRGVACTAETDFSRKEFCKCELFCSDFCVAARQAGHHASFMAAPSEDRLILQPRPEELHLPFYLYGHPLRRRLIPCRAPVPVPPPTPLCRRTRRRTLMKLIVLPIALLTGAFAMQTSGMAQVQQAVPGGATGANVFCIQAGDLTSGSFVATYLRRGAGTWEERNQEGGAFNYEEKGRDEQERSGLRLETRILGKINTSS